MQQPTAAINILQTIPSRQRSPKCQMSLGNLYRRAGMERPAVTCYKVRLTAGTFVAHSFRGSAKNKQILHCTLVSKDLVIIFVGYVNQGLRFITVSIGR
jgi:hypothetical protein